MKILSYLGMPEVCRSTFLRQNFRNIRRYVHLNFNLDNSKIVSTVTDNGSNFVKAFKEYGLKIEEEESDSEDNESCESLSFVDLNSEESV